MAAINSDSGSMTAVSNSVATASDMIVSGLVRIDAVHEFTAESIGAKELLKSVTSKKPIKASKETKRICDSFLDGFAKTHANGFLLLLFYSHTSLSVDFLKS